MSDPLPPSHVASAVEPVSCVRVVPEQFKIEVVLHEEAFLELTLFNTSSSLCTFKVKTTARDRYLLRPTQDYIAAGGSKVCKIVMSALRTYPDLTNPKNLKDKFLVQATNIASEVPDLTKFWKDLETQHNPKAGVYKYAETKIKCKLSVPAKYRAADATKRGLEEEAAATAAAMASAGGGDKSGEQQLSAQQQLQSQPMQSQHPSQPRSSAAASDDLHGRRKMSEDDMSSSSFAALVLADPVASHAVPAAAAAAAAPSSSAAATAPSSASLPASSAAASTSSSAAPVTVSGSSVASAVPAGAVSVDPAALARQLKSAESKYAELMAFVVTTTQQLETERQDKESWEARSQAASQSLAAALAKLEATERQLREAREETKRALQSGSGADESKLDSEGDAAAARRRKLDSSVGSSSSSSSKASDASKSAASAAQSTPALSTKKPQPGLALAFWQIALMALVCFVLGRIFA